MATESFYTESGNSPPTRADLAIAPSSKRLTRLDHVDDYEELWEAILDAYGFTPEGLNLLHDEYEPHDWDDFTRDCLENDVSALKYAEIYNAKAQEVRS